MNKHLICLILAGTLSVSLVGCNTSTHNATNSNQNNDNIDKTPTVEIVNETTLNPDEAIKLLKETRASIIENVDSLSQDEFDEMVLTYDLGLRNNYMQLRDKYSSEYYWETLNNIPLYDLKPHVNGVADESIKKELQDVLDAGYDFYFTEGVCQYQLKIDYTSFFAELKTSLSPTLIKYYTLMLSECEEPLTYGDYLSIGYDELANRFIVLEEVISRDTITIFKEEMHDYLKDYTWQLTNINSPISNTMDENGKAMIVVVNSYRKLSESDLPIASKLGTEMLDILETSNYVLDYNNVDLTQSISDIYYSIDSLIDATYPPEVQLFNND